MNPISALRGSTCVVIISLMLIGLLLPMTLFAQTVSPTATVVVAGLNVRSGPGVNFARVGQVTRNAELDVVGQTQNCAWLRVKLDDGSEGWVSGGAQYVRLNVPCSSIRASAQDEPGKQAVSANPVPAVVATDVRSPTVPQLALYPGSGLRERPAADIFAEVSPSVAFIETPSATGSGALVDHGYLLTNAHLVWPYSVVRVVFPDGSEFEDVPVLAWDLMADLALVGPLETDIPAIRLVDGSDLKVGSNVYLVGYPAEVENLPQPTITNGILSRVRTWDRLDFDFFQVDATSVGGQSGGILVTYGGDVVGISTYIYQGFGLVSSVADALPRLNTLLGNDTGITLDRRPFPAETESTLLTGTLDGWYADDLFVLREPTRSKVELEVEGVGSPEIKVSSIESPEIDSSQSATSESNTAFTVKDNSPHFVRVSQLSSNEHSYVLTSTHPLAAYPDADDMRQLTIGATITGAIDEPQDEDFYEIALKKGQTVAISVDALNIHPYIFLSYYSDSLQESVYDVDSGGGIFGQNARLIYQAPADDTYQIFVSDLKSERIGGYFLTVDEAPADAEVTEPYEHIELADAGRAWYKTDEYGFAIHYPVDWQQETLSECGVPAAITSGACWSTDNGMSDMFFVFESSQAELPRQQRGRSAALTRMRDFLESQAGTEILSVEEMTTVQKLKADIIEVSVLSGAVKGVYFLFVDEREEVAFLATIVMDSDSYDTSQSFINSLFNSFRYWNMSEITETAAYHYDEGVRLNLTREYTAAIEAFSRAIELDPTLALAYKMRGWNYYYAQKDEKALADMREAVALSPKDSYVQDRYAMLLWELGRLEDAQSASDQATNLEPTRYGHRNNRALIYATAGNFTTALGDLRRVASSNDGELPANIQDTRAYVYLLKGDDKAALADYQALFDRDFITSYSLLGAGVAALRSGDEERGRILIERGRAKLAEEIASGDHRRLDSQLIQLQTWADELYPVAEP